MINIESVNEGDKFTLEGKDKKGKQIVRRVGKDFECTKVDVNNFFILVKSLKTGYTRWVNLEYDEHFNIKGCGNKNF